MILAIFLVVPLIVPILGLAGTVIGGAASIIGNAQKRKMQREMISGQERLLQKEQELQKQQEEARLKLLREQQKLALLQQSQRPTLKKQIPWLPIVIIGVIILLLWKRGGF